MIQGGDLPEDIIRLILIKRFSDSVLSLEHWKSCLEALAVCRKWRNIGIPLLYHNVIIEYLFLDDTFVIANSNIPLALINGYIEIPRALLLHTPKFWSYEQKHLLLVENLPYAITQYTFRPGLMRDFWRRYPHTPYSLAAASIESALQAMPNLSHFFFSTDELIDGEGPRGSNFTNYSVGRQIAPPSTPINVTLGVDVMLESSQLQANIDTQELLMYRQENDDYVETLSAEYIDRLIVTKLPEFLLLNSAHVIPDIPIHPFPDRYPHGTPWLFVTNRSMFFFADIRFDGHVTLPTSYSLAIFDRQNDRMLVDAHYDVLNEENQDNASSDDTAFDESSDESFDESSVDESHDDSASDNTIVDM